MKEDKVKREGERGGERAHAARETKHVSFGDEVANSRRDAIDFRIHQFKEEEDKAGVPVEIIISQH
jgi:hypothetical protein